MQQNKSEENATEQVTCVPSNMFLCSFFFFFIRFVREERVAFFFVFVLELHVLCTTKHERALSSRFRWEVGYSVSRRFVQTQLSSFLTVRTVVGLHEQQVSIKARARDTPPPPPITTFFVIYISTYSLTCVL